MSNIWYNGYTHTIPYRTVPCHAPIHEGIYEWVICCLKYESVFVNTPISQIPQYTCPISPNSSSIYQNRTEHIPVLNGALWDVGQVRCRICEIGLLLLCTETSAITFSYLLIVWLLCLLITENGWMDVQSGVGGVGVGWGVGRVEFASVSNIMAKH